MAVLTGAEGQLRVGTNSTQISKVRDWALDISKDALECTSLGDYDREYVEGLRGTSGSANLMYDPADQAMVELLKSVLNHDNDQSNPTASTEVYFVLNSSSLNNKTFKCKGFITGVSQSVSVGAVSAASIRFQVSGKPDGTF